MNIQDFRSKALGMCSNIQLIPVRIRPLSGSRVVLHYADSGDRFADLHPEAPGASFAATLRTMMASQADAWSNGRLDMDGASEARPESEASADAVIGVSLQATQELVAFLAHVPTWSFSGFRV